jgi:hypothetical protein
LGTISGTPLEGRLAQRDFPHLVHDLAEQGWTGLLTLTHQGIRSVVVREGRLVFATSSNPDDRLGELLLRRGRLSLRQLRDAGSSVRPGKRLGTILVEHGVLSPKELVAAVVEHTQEIIYGAFQWTEGLFRLEPGGDPAESITLNMRTPDLIFEGIRRIEAWSRIERGMGGLDARYVMAPQALEVGRSMTLPPGYLEILTRLEGELGVETICAASSLSSFEVCRSLWAFDVIGLVKRADTPAAESADDEGLGLLLSSE